MTKKDILIFLNIFIIGLKGIVKQKSLKIFSEDICTLLSDSVGISEFYVKFNAFRLSCTEPELHRNFYKYLNRVNKVLDKVDYAKYI